MREEADAGAKIDRPRSARIAFELAPVVLALASVAGTLALIVSMYKKPNTNRVATTDAVVIAEPPKPEPKKVEKPKPKPKPKRVEEIKPEIAAEPDEEPEIDNPTAVELAKIEAVREEETKRAEAIDGKARALLDSHKLALAEADRWKRREALIRAQANALAKRAQAAETENEVVAMERDVLARRRDEEKADLDRSNKLAVQGGTYAVFPYKGAGGTWQHPIPIECASGTVTVQPLGLTLSMLDINTGYSVRTNPLAAAVVRETMRIQQTPTKDGDQRVPYVLFIIRPDGIRPYYEARNLLEKMGIAFGYELVDQNWVITYPDSGIDFDRKKLLAENDANPPRPTDSIPSGFRSSGSSGGGSSSRRSSGSGSGGDRANDPEAYVWRDAVPATDSNSRLLNPSGGGGMVPRSFGEGRLPAWNRDSGNSNDAQSADATENANAGSNRPRIGISGYPNVASNDSGPQFPGYPAPSSSPISIGSGPIGGGSDAGSSGRARQGSIAGGNINGSMNSNSWGNSESSMNPDGTANSNASTNPNGSGNLNSLSNPNGSGNLNSATNLNGTANSNTSTNPNGSGNSSSLSNPNGSTSSGTTPANSPNRSRVYASPSGGPGRYPIAASRIARYPVGSNSAGGSGSGSNSGSGVGAISTSGTSVGSNSASGSSNGAPDGSGSTSALAGNSLNDAGSGLGANAGSGTGGLGSGTAASGTGSGGDGSGTGGSASGANAGTGSSGSGSGSTGGVGVVADATPPPRELPPDALKGMSSSPSLNSTSTSDSSNTTANAATDPPSLESPRTDSNTSGSISTTASSTGTPGDTSSSGTRIAQGSSNSVGTSGTSSSSGTQVAQGSSGTIGTQGSSSSSGTAESASNAAGSPSNASLSGNPLLGMSSPNLSGPTPPAAASSIPPSVASLIPLLNLSGNQQNSTSVNSNAGSKGSSSVKGGSSASAAGSASASAGSPGSGASGGSNSSSEDEPRFSGLNDFVPQRSNTFEIALICEKRWVRVEPGGYRITPDRLKAGDRTLPTLLGRLLQKQRDAEPSKDWTPALRMLVERDGDSTYWSAMRQVYVSGLDWPITINLVGSYAPRIGDWELK